MHMVLTESLPAEKLLTCENLGFRKMISRLLVGGVTALILGILSVPSWAATSDTSSVLAAEKALRDLFGDFVEICTIDELPDNPLSHEFFDLNPAPVVSYPEGLGNSRMLANVRPHWKQDKAKFFTGFQRVSSYDFNICGVFTSRDQHLPLPYKKILSDTFPGNTWGTEISRDRPWFTRYHGNHTWRQPQMENDSLCLEVSRSYIALFRAPFCVLE